MPDETNGNGRVNGPNGERDERGYFKPGNALGNCSAPGKGNPQTRRMKELRQSIVDATTEDQLKAVMEAMRVAAVTGDVPAARCWLEYVRFMQALAGDHAGD